MPRLSTVTGRANRQRPLVKISKESDIKTRRMNSAQNVEISKPRGFDRNLQPDAIVGTAIDTKRDKRRMYLMRWHGTNELDLIPSSELMERCPEVLIRFLEQSSPLVRKCADRRRIYERYLEDLQNFPPDPIPVDESIAKEPIGLALNALVADLLDDETDKANAPAEPTTSTALHLPSADNSIETIAECSELDSAGSTHKSLDLARTTDVQIENIAERNQSENDVAKDDDTAERNKSDNDVAKDDNLEPVIPLKAIDEPMETDSKAEESPAVVDEDDTFLSEIANVAAEHQARTEALPESVIPNVSF